MRFGVALLSLFAFSCGTATTNEVTRLAKLLEWRSGTTVADVGSGGGEIAKAAADIVGVSGSVYATEVDAGKLRNLRKLESRYRNLKVVGGSDEALGLPPACCDSAVLRGVYHHLIRPSDIDSDLFRVMKPGGRVAVIDFAPKHLLSWFFPVKGAPGNRGGHGVARPVVVEELKRAGFTIDTEIPDWPGGQYCVIARKPVSGR